MPDQLLFPELASPMAEQTSLFLALRPDEAARREITERAEHFFTEHSLRGRRVDEERYHVTLHFLGRRRGWTDSEIQSAGKAAAAVAASTPSFRLDFDKCGSFAKEGHSGPLVLCSNTENDLFSKVAERLTVELIRHGIRPEGKLKPRAHLTLCYNERYLPMHTIPAIGWQVHELVLVQSFQGRSHHVSLGSWSFLPSVP